MDAAQDPVIARLSPVIHARGIAARLHDAVQRVEQRLDGSHGPMAWEIVPLTVFGGALPETVRSCWIFVIRPGAATGAERHPNSYQRSCSLLGGGRFELYDGRVWRPHALTSGTGEDVGQHWVSIPPATWHRLRVGSSTWGMVSFHTVAAGDLIEENPRDPDRLDGLMQQRRYADR